MLSIKNSFPLSFPTSSQGSDPASSLPKEVMLQIFSYLNTSDLGRSCLVSKQWRQLTSDPILWEDLEKFFPSLKVFDKAAWQKHVDLSSYGLTVEDALPLNTMTMAPILKKFFSSFSIEEDAGVTLLAIPKGLTLKKLVKLADSPRFGNATKFRQIWAPLIEGLGDIPVGETYRIVITNNILKESQHLTFNQQKDLLNGRGCDMPKLLELATLLVISYISSQNRLYKKTYSHCLEQFNSCQLAVGGFNPEGIAVSDSYPTTDDDGVGAVLSNFSVFPH